MILMNGNVKSCLKKYSNYDFLPFPSAIDINGLMMMMIMVSGLSPVEGEVVGPLVTVPKAFDDDFSNFFASNGTDERIELRDEDLENVTNSTSQL